MQHTGNLRVCIMAAALLAAGLLSPVASQAKRTVAQKKQVARTQFENAERMREALNGTPQKKRTRRAYTLVMDAYRKVYYTAPTSSKADASALAVGELMVDYGRAFDDEKSFRDAIGQFQFLRREYPGSRYRFQALFTIGQVFHDDLGDITNSKENFEEFLKRYPHHELADQAKDAIAAINEESKAAKAGKKPAKKKKDEDVIASKAEPKAKSTKAEDSDEETPADAALKNTAQITPPESEHRGRLPLLTSIRHWSTPDYTRVAIDLEDEVKYEAGRVPSPDRIFFDLHDTKLASELVGKSFDVGDGFLRKIRVAQYTTTMARVVLEVDDVTGYSAFLLPNPYRLIIDIHGNKQPKTAIAQNTPGKPQAQNTPAEKTEDKSQKTTETAKANPPATVPAPTKSQTEPAKPVVTAPPATAAEKKAADQRASDAANELADADSPAKKELEKKEVKATPAPTSAPIAEKIAPTKVETADAESAKPAEKNAEKSARGKKGKNAKPAEPESIAHEAAPTSSGDRSLIRALGLKIGKIVVDAGHGGHDTGTIGPNGLLEKDLVLDVALRLGKLLETRLGAEVVYTRQDDTFIPLETRTAIANRERADLFISVHANSSRDSDARGVETYYLNFTSSPEALEVAARENAVSEKSIHELQDLVKKIALKEKIDESREFATDVQESLYGGLSLRNAGV